MRQAQGREGWRRHLSCYPHQHSSPGFLCSGSSIAGQQPSIGEDCEPGCFTHHSPVNGDHTQESSSHRRPSAAGRAVTLIRRFYWEDRSRGSQTPTGEEDPTQPQQRLRPNRVPSCPKAQTSRAHHQKGSQQVREQRMRRMVLPCRYSPPRPRDTHRAPQREGFQKRMKGPFPQSSVRLGCPNNMIHAWISLLLLSQIITNLVD